MINRPCDSCGKKDKPVYPVYKVLSRSVVELERNELTGQLQNKTHSYLCKECNEKNRKINK